MPLSYQNSLFLIKRLLSRGNVEANLAAGGDASDLPVMTPVDVAGLSTATSSDMPAAMHSGPLSGVMASTPSTPGIEGHTFVGAHGDTPTGGKHEPDATASDGAAQSELPVALEPYTGQHYFFDFAEMLGFSPPRHVPTGLEAPSPGSLPPNAGYRVRLGSEIVDQVALHRAAGLGDSITFVIDKARLLAISSNAEGMYFFSMQAIASPSAPSEGLAFTALKKQASAILTRSTRT